MSDLLDRFHRVLVQEIRRNHPEYLDSRFTVAEIYQNLVPYRTHRDAIGVEMNGDYEHTLLRLLAGEGDYVILESEVGRREIREELESPNPHTGLFRDYAAADVRLTGAHESVPEAPGGSQAEDEDSVQGQYDIADLAPDQASEEAEEAGAPVAGSVPDDSPRLFVMSDPDEDGPAGEEESGGATDFETPAAPAFEAPTPDADGSDEAGAADPSGDDEACHWCRAALPERSVLNFCPFCGSNLKVKPCPGCGEELDPEWRFCPACGAEAGD